MLLRISIAIFALAMIQNIATADIYNLNVQIIQVCDDSAADCTNLGPNGGNDTSYLYSSQVDTIWDQAGIQVTYLPTVQWNSTDALRLTSSERAAIYANTFTSSGDPLPGLGSDAIQIFFVKDHPGTGYTGTAGTGWVDNPLSNPSSSGRNAGNAQLYIDGTTSSNGRSVMSNEGIAVDQLAGTIAHEIGHLLGLRHLEDVSGEAAGTTQDPIFTVGATTANLMWGSGMGPSYDSGMTLAQNFDLTPEQIAAAIYNGTRLDPDGNGIGVLQSIPEPGSTLFLSIIGMAMMARRRRA